MVRVLRPGGTLLPADLRSPERGVWRVLGSLHRVASMQRRVPPLEPLVAHAGLVELRSGDAPPWLHYVRAQKP